MIGKERVTDALQLLSEATTPNEIAEASGRLAGALGLERFAVLDLVGDRLAALYHNAPAELAAEFADLDRLWLDPHIIAARSRPIPVLWSEATAGPADFYLRAASLGYRCGVAASSTDGTGGTCVLMLSGSKVEIDSTDLVPTMGFAALAAPHLLRALTACRPAPERSPLTERELTCLAHVLAGRSMKQIARDLGIGTRTVGQYLERARSKLSVKSSYAAGMSAIHRGWIDTEQVTALASAAATPGARQG